MKKYLIGYDISGHMLIEAPNPQAAAATAIGLVRTAVRSLEAQGEVEYRCPSGRVIEADSVPIRRAPRRADGESARPETSVSK